MKKILVACVLVGSGVAAFLMFGGASEEDGATPGAERTAATRDVPIDSDPVPKKKRASGVKERRPAVAPGSRRKAMAREDSERGGSDEAAGRHPLDLTPGEESILSEYGMDRLAEAVMETEEAYKEASGEAEREAADERYTAALNLASKLTPKLAPEPSDERFELEEAWIETLVAHNDALVNLEPAERAKELGKLKDDFFQETTEEEVTRQ